MSRQILAFSTLLWTALSGARIRRLAVAVSAFLSSKELSATALPPAALVREPRWRRRGRVPTERRGRRPALGHRVVMETTAEWSVAAILPAAILTTPSATLAERLPQGAPSPDRNEIRNTPAAPTDITESALSAADDAAASTRTARQRASDQRLGELMRRRWQEPAFRERVLRGRREASAVRRQASQMQHRWQDPAFRERMSRARRGRPAWNRGIPRPEHVRERIRAGIQGRVRSEHTRLKISAARTCRAPSPIAPNGVALPSEMGTRNAYAHWRTQFLALVADLQLWSDSFYAEFGRRPRRSDLQSVLPGESTPRWPVGLRRAMQHMTPTLAFKCQRFLEVRQMLSVYDAELCKKGDQVIVIDPP